METRRLIYLFTAITRNGSTSITHTFVPQDPFLYKRPHALHWQAEREHLNSAERALDLKPVTKRLLFSAPVAAKRICSRSSSSNELGGSHSDTRAEHVCFAKQGRGRSGEESAAKPGARA